MIADLHTQESAPRKCDIPSLSLRILCNPASCLRPEAVLMGAQKMSSLPLLSRSMVLVAIVAIARPLSGQRAPPSTKEICSTSTT